MHEKLVQGIENDIIEPGAEVFENKGAIACRERLGGVLKHYYREAA